MTDQEKDTLNGRVRFTVPADRDATGTSWRIVVSFPVEFVGCPCYRYALAHHNELVGRFSTAPDVPTREKAQEEAAALAHLLLQVVAPLAGEARGPKWRAEFERLAQSLQNLCRFDAAKHPWAFPDDHGLQLLRDRLDEIALAVRHRPWRRCLLADHLGQDCRDCGRYA